MRRDIFKCPYRQSYMFVGVVAHMQNLTFAQGDSKTAAEQEDG